MSLKPEAAPRAGDAMWWRWLAASVAPNPRVLLLVTVGWVTELVLLGCVSDNIYYVSRPARWLAVMFAAWFWVYDGLGGMAGGKSVAAPAGAQPGEHYLRSASGCTG